MKATFCLQLAGRRVLLACLIGAQCFSPWFLGEARAMSMRRAPFHQAGKLPKPLAEPRAQPAWRTLAGFPGVTGTNDGPGVVARFCSPCGIVTCPSGDSYVADSGNHTIRRISPQGIVNTVAGQPGVSGWRDGHGTNALFKNPAALALDGDDNLYVADPGNCVVRQINAAGVVTTIAGQPGAPGYRDGTGTNALLESSFGGLALDTERNVYVTDSHNHVVRKINSAGLVSTVAGQPGQFGYQDGIGTNVLFGYSLGGLAVDTNGNLYVADSDNCVIRKITPVGVVTTWVGQQGRWGYRDGNGTNVWFAYPRGLTADNKGNLYVTEPENRCIRKVSPDGEVSTLGGDAWAYSTHHDGLGPFAKFNAPQAVALDPSGHLLVADFETIRYGRLGPEPRLQILQQPRSQAAEEGANVTLSVMAQCAAALTYQWLVNGQPIAAATNATLVVSNLTEADGGEYRVGISDGVGVVLSCPASLRVQRTQSSSPDPMDHWQRLAGPPLTEIHGLAYGNGLYVAISGGYEWEYWPPPELRGSVATSMDGETWVKQFPITSECLNDVAFGNGTFVTVGRNGTVFTSTNGLAWEAQTLTSEGLPDLHGIAFDQGIFVAVSGDANGSIWTSTDGCTWTNRGIDFGISLVAVAAEGGRFIAAGNTILTSTNGVDWEPADVAGVTTNYLEQEITLEHIACGNGTILAAKHWGNGVLASSDGVQWRDAAPTNGCLLSRVTCGNSQFVAVDEYSGGVSLSTDGLEWSAPAPITCGEGRANYPHLRFEHELFVATGDAGALFTSSDGKAWVLREPRQALHLLPDTIIEFGSRWFGVSWAGIETTTNGSDWSVVVRTNSLTALVHGDGKLVAAGGNDVIFSSEDGGATWMDRSPHLNYGINTPYLSRIAFGGGVFVAIGRLSTSHPDYIERAHILCSSNLVQWTAVSFAPTNSLSDVAYGGGLFVALLNRNKGNREILTSTNGLSWKTSAMFPIWLNTVAYGNGRFVVGTEYGTITSFDGKAWNRNTGQDAGYFNRIVFGNELFLASDYGGLKSSSDGVAWTPCTAPAVSYFQTIAAGDGVFVAVGEDGILYQSGPFQRLGNPRWLPGLGVEWTVTGAPHINYRIEFSEDLLNWQTLTRVTNAAAATPFLDPDAATRPARFYRVATEPAPTRSISARLPK